MNRGYSPIFAAKSDTMTTEEEIRKDAVLEVARLMMMAARTAPKGKGRDTLFVAMASASEIGAIAERMDEIARGEGLHFFSRDAANLRISEALVLIGTRLQPLGLRYCGYCGLGDCVSKQEHPSVPCAFNLTDLGIALGSAASVASVHHVDNRIMYSAGRAALDLGLCGDGVTTVFAIPLSVGAKNPYFDR